MSTSETCSDIAQQHLRLSMADGVGPILFDRLVERFGSVEAVLAAPTSHLQEVDRISSKVASAIQAAARSDEWKAEVELAGKLGVRIVCREDAGYPEPLRHIPDPPICLYVIGEIRREDALSIAIVGSRQASIYGLEQAQRFAELLSQTGLTIISGMARGIDQAAHMAAMRVGGRTIAVLGCGLSLCYPADSVELRDRIAKCGAVISELPLATAPSVQTFPPRNRIIAGLSLGTLVVEAARRSGALITARVASEYNREVFALPGRVDTPTAMGTNDLISQGFALNTVSGRGGGPVKDESGAVTFFGFGKWKNANPITKQSNGGDDNFKFTNYLGLSNLEKTSIKYIPCGVNSLCLKTRDAVKAYPLADKCNDIKNIQLIYDAKGDTSLKKEVLDLVGIGSGTAIIKSTKLIPLVSSKVNVVIGAITLLISAGDLVSDSVAKHISFKTSDFHVVSPCEINGLTVEKTACNNAKPEKYVDFTLTTGLDIETDYSPCYNLIKYPIYQYGASSNSGKLSQVKNKDGTTRYHYSCVEPVGTDISPLPTETFNPGDTCIQIKVHKLKKDYCWTPNPYKTSDDIIEAIFNTRFAVEIPAFIYGYPIGKSTSFFSNGAEINAVVLKPTQTSLKIGMDFLEALDRKWWWGWP